MKIKKLDFTDQERQLIEEAYQNYMQTITIIARLRGLKPGGAVQLAEDRSGLMVPDQQPEN